MNLLQKLKTWLQFVHPTLYQSVYYLRWRLLLGYLIIMSLIFGSSAAASYLFFTHSLQQRLNQELLTLAQAAAPSLNTIKTKGRQSLDREVPWRSIFSQREQSLEWFDADGKLLAQEGSNFPSHTLVKNLSLSQLSQSSPLFQRQSQLWTVTIAVYEDTFEAKTLQLEGYIRASQSTEELEAALQQLKLGLVIGCFVALSLISLSSIYLTRQALAPIQKSWQQFRQFAADASHELRNPLTRISMALEVILQTSNKFRRLSDVRKLKIIQNATVQMQSLVEDLLFLARTDAVSIQYTQAKSPVILLEELLLNLAEDFELQAKSKDINFEVYLLSDIHVRGDARQLTRLFANLLSNAIKYTDSQGKISLSLERSRRSVLISIQDTGIGIAPEYLSYIFRRFWRAERARAYEEEGLGLGLPIAQMIALQHGGEITVSSRVGAGSCFRVRLPLANK